MLLIIAAIAIFVLGCFVGFVLAAIMGTLAGR